MQKYLGSTNEEILRSSSLASSVSVCLGCPAEQPLIQRKVRCHISKVSFHLSCLDRGNMPGTQGASGQILARG